MTRLIILALILLTRFSDYNPNNGYISRYDKSPTYHTLAYRFTVGEIPPPEKVFSYDLRLAVYDCERIGDTGILTVNDVDYSFIAFDCAGRGQLDGSTWMEQNNIVAELGWWSYVMYPELLHEYGEITWSIEN